MQISINPAILNVYAFRTVKKDKKRFRAKCVRANKGCKWIFLSFLIRNRIAMSMEGKIIPSILEALTAQSKAIKDCKVLSCGNSTAEVTAPTKSGARFRYAVNLELKTCGSLGK
jgi:hypothetical protein